MRERFNKPHRNQSYPHGHNVASRVILAEQESAAHPLRCPDLLTGFVGHTLARPVCQWVKGCV